MNTGIAFETVKLPLGKISLGSNPRRTMDRTELAQLADSIKSVGLIQPVIVRVKGEAFELVVGQRRFEAHKLAGLTEIEAVVRPYTDADLLDVQVIENIQRADMAPLDEAVAFKTMFEKGATASEIAATVGRSTTYVLQRNQLNHLSKTLATGLSKGFLNVAQALVFARIASHDTQNDLLEEVIESKVLKAPIEDSAANIADHALRHLLLALKNAPFPVNDENLVPKAGSCATCQKRSGSCAALFPELDTKKDDRCLDITCWQVKNDANTKRRLDLAKAQGKRVLNKDEAAKIQNYGSGYSDLGNTTYIGDQMKKVADLVKGADVEIVVAVDQHNQIHEYVADKDLSALKKARAPKASAKEEARHDAERDGRRAAAKKALLDKAVLGFSASQAVVLAGKAAEKPLGLKLAKQLAHLSIDKLSHDSVRNLAKALKLEIKKGSYGPDYNAALSGWADQVLKAGDFASSLAVMTAAAVISTGSFSITDTAHKAFLQLLGLDRKESEKKVKALKAAEKEAKLAARATLKKAA